MPRTTNKGVRFTQAELERVALLRAQLPEYSSEADLLRHAALLGLLVLATQATRPHLPPYAGYTADDLAALLRPRLLPALDFLLAHGALPALAAAHQAAPAQTQADERQSEAAIAQAAADLAGLGIGFLDDDERD